jgi:tetratricopeptide (TPR) repeat protein
MLDRSERYRATVLSLRGQLLYAQGRYDEAARMFERAQAAGAHGGIAKDAAPEAALLQGLSLYRSGEFARARRSLRQASRADLDPSLTLATRQLNAAAENADTPLFEFELGVGYEYDSNVPLVDDNLVLPEDLPTKDDGRFVLEPRLRFTPLRTSRLEAGMATTNYFSFQDRLTEFDLSSYQVGAFANYR